MDIGRIVPHLSASESKKLVRCDVSTNLRLPHCMFYMIKRVNEINISQSI